MGRISRAKVWRVIGSRAAVPVLTVVMVAGCGVDNVGVGTTSSFTPPQTLASGTSTTSSLPPRLPPRPCLLPPWRQPILQSIGQIPKPSAAISSMHGVLVMEAECGS